LAAEVASKTDGDSQEIDIDNVFDSDGSEDKEIAAMGVAQTIGTVQKIRSMKFWSILIILAVRLYLLWTRRRRSLLRCKKLLFL
jgi:hypothetical protein